MNVLFLANNYNTISIACLTQLLDANLGTVTVGIYDPKGDSLLRSVRKIVRRHGPFFLLKSGMTLVRAALRGWLRKLGISLKTYASVEELAAAYGVNFFRCQRINEPDALERIRALKPDLIAVAVFSQILKAEVIAIPPMGCINVHASLLPKYRGPNPFYWVLRHGEQETGVTVCYLEEGIDAGDILLQEPIPILPEDTEITLRDKSAVVGARLLVEAIRRMQRGQVEPTRQNEAEASYYSFPPPGASVL